MIDASEGDPAERFALIDGELAAYGAGLDELPQIVVLNTMDVPGGRVADLDDDRILRVVRYSAATGAGIDELVNALSSSVPAARAGIQRRQDVMVEFLVYRPRPEARHGFRIRGRTVDTA